MPEEYIQLEVAADPRLFEELVGIMARTGFNGFWEEGSSLRCYIRRDRWSPADLTDLQRLADGIAEAHAAGRPLITLSMIPARDWNAEWEAILRPLRVTDRIVITPSRHAYVPLTGDILIRIDPKMSFGTGYHETTRLILRLLEKRLRGGMRVLDVGTGSGVLAIASIKLGAAGAVALDIDEWACENAVENASLNGVRDKISVIRGELSAIGPNQFDLIAANIQRNVIESLLPQMTLRLAPHGSLLLSGLLLSDEMPMHAALSAAGFTIDASIRENEWLALATTPFENRPEPATIQSHSTPS